MYYKEVYAYVYKQTMNKGLSMDLTHEIFISILKSIDNYDEKKASFRTWLYRISTHRLVDYYRSENYKYNRGKVPIDDVVIYAKEDFEVAVENIIRIVNNLNFSSQQIFRLKIFADYTFFEISKVLEIPESTVKTRYYSMIRKIREYFKEG
ncbi:RNA polymerase sigma factor [Anaeromonas gelatinilytica]|uniref:RNA polymerase sigma factor n=1 Tax=Anaeromonas gelatinilytica TaxID=2683194 RepID=UPI003315F53E